MKSKDIKDLSVDELRVKERDLTDELFRLKIRHTTGQLDSPAALKNVRRDIARIKTAMKQKELQK
ncbi:MAG: 50S ribosomal protein L29 [Syntrophales bacterium]|jgi:large subunit ribosomal protein L29|nr:50S ribosomal protein L29 [Syntrophales bacterium]MCU0553156.1 50S ribosomal protein L29 [Syntrophales bacterium]MCU0582226.1 50S ribosomal protein L29 [Syntrophales bacterium]